MTRLADILFRRTDIALAGELGREVVEEVASIAAAVLAWDEAAVQDEIEDVIRIAVGRHGMAPDRFKKRENRMPGDVR